VADALAPPYEPLSAPGASLPGAKTSQTIFASVVKPMSTPNFFMLPS